MSKSFAMAFNQFGTWRLPGSRLAFIAPDFKKKSLIRKKHHKKTELIETVCKIKFHIPERIC